MSITKKELIYLADVEREARKAFVAAAKRTLGQTYYFNIIDVQKAFRKYWINRLKEII